MNVTPDSRESRALARELKVVVDPALASRIRAWARERLEGDPYADGPAHDEYRITSLYFDTTDLAVFHRRDSYGRAKYRVRRYGQSDTVFLERKMRTSGFLVKRRTQVPLGVLPHLRNGSGPSRWPGDWFARRLRLRSLKPTSVVSYLRTARVGTTEHGPYRLTLDEGLTAAECPDLVVALDRGSAILPGSTIVELKFRVQPPLVFRELLHDFKLHPERVSKYRLALMALRGLAAPLDSARSANA
jgi:hypothetical protein